jgi:putative phosphoesterase
MLYVFLTFISNYRNMLIYVLSDTHISSNEKEIPEWITNKLKKADLILINGDITSENVLEELKAYSKVLAVKGNCDFLNLPKTNVFDLKGIKCGQIHGDGVSPRGDKEQLYDIAKSLNVDVLFMGHTHVYTVYVYKKKLFINPGSATGSPGLICDEEIETIAEVLVNEEEINVKILSENKVLIDFTMKKIYLNNIL